jgi:hypothetical protein
MTTLLTILGLAVLLAATFVAGRFWPQGRRIANPKISRFADADYWEVYIQNERHLFTREQVNVARERALRYEHQ